MIAYSYRPRRRSPEGNSEAGRLYRARIRLDGEFRTTDVSLKTSDKRTADRMLAELVTERERVKAGLIAPRLERESAQQPITKHLEDFVADLKVLGRVERYLSNLVSRVSRVAEGCRWQFPGQINGNDFVAWRTRQVAMAPKTLNEYLNALNSFLNWMVKHGRIAANPLKNLPRVDVRGRQQRRRAFTDEELNRLLSVARPDMRLLYLAAAFTGLRIGELRQVVWGDLHLDAKRPHITVRAITAKNRREAVLPLHPQLVDELKAVKQPGTRAGERVFSQHPHPDRLIRKDMAAAGIPRIDDMGRKLDFHALRYTFATKLAASGTPMRSAQELLRHSDPRLTANIYTDPTQLPTFDAVASLPWQASPKLSARPESEVRNGFNHTAIDTQILDKHVENSSAIVPVEHAHEISEVVKAKQRFRFLSFTDREFKSSGRQDSKNTSHRLGTGQRRRPPTAKPDDPHTLAHKAGNGIGSAGLDAPTRDGYSTPPERLGSLENPMPVGSLGCLQVSISGDPVLVELNARWWRLPPPVRLAIGALLKSQP